MTLTLDEVMSELRGDTVVLNTVESESLFTNGMSVNLSDMIERVGHGGDFTKDELSVFDKQAKEFAAIYLQ